MPDIFNCQEVKLLTGTKGLYHWKYGRRKKEGIMGRERGNGEGCTPISTKTYHRKKDNKNLIRSSCGSIA